MHPSSAWTSTVAGSLPIAVLLVDILQVIRAGVDEALPARAGAYRREGNRRPDHDLGGLMAVVLIEGTDREGQHRFGVREARAS